MSEFPNDLHPWIPFLAVALLLCALLAWLANYRLKTLFPQPGRRLLTLFVSIQAFLLLTNFFMVRGSTDVFPEILWNLDLERTIPSVHSTIQLLLLASLCCMNGFRNRGPGLPERAWWLVLGLATIGLAMLEFFEFFRYMIPETPIVWASGVSLLPTALLMVWHRRRDSPRRNGLLLFLGGMGLWAFGVFRLDFPVVPNTFKALEETVETLGIAIAIAGAAGYAQASRPTSHFPLRRFLASLCATCAALALLLAAFFTWSDSASPQSRFLQHVDGKQITANVGDGALALRAWSVETIRPAKLRKIELWLHVIRPLTSDFGYTVQLIDQASQDAILTFNERSEIDVRNWVPGELFVRKLAGYFRVPGAAPANRAQWLTVSFWKIEGDEYPPLKIDFSDYPTLADTHVILDEVVLRKPPDGFSQDEALARFANGFALQQAVFPDRVRAGQSIDVEFLWNSVSDGVEDWTQFLHFEPQADGSFWNVDQFPLGLRLPTRLWYDGMQSGETWSFTVPGDLAAGAYDVYTGLYRLADPQRLEVTLADGRQPDDRRIPLGSIHVEN